MKYLNDGPHAYTNQKRMNVGKENESVGAMTEVRMHKEMWLHLNGLEDFCRLA